ncbi:MAG: endonuclease V [Proteobacteria bacterium]|nr:endonuclease V [Pseudomonadota bacterium]
MELKDLVNLQNALKERIVLSPFEKDYKLVLAVDSSYLKGEDRIISVAIIYNKLDKIVVEKQFNIGKISFPYIPGFLSFREIDNTISAINKIKTNYDLIIVDGQGIAHPRNFGFASHLGVLVNKPTIGCAKSKLIGEFVEPEDYKGAFSYLYYNSLKVGAVVRTKKGVKPLFISPGHMVDIDSSVKIIIELTEKYRQPEPIRVAHSFAEEVKKAWKR